MKKQDYNQDEKKSLESVLDMGFFIQNSNGDILISHYGDFTIRFHNGMEKDYSEIDTALKAIFKKH